MQQKPGLLLPLSDIKALEAFHVSETAATDQLATVYPK